MSESAQQRERRIRRRLQNDFLHYAFRCLKVKTKAGSIAPFVVNDAQAFIHEKLEEQLRTLGRIRALILKGRQQGCSTYVEGRFYWKVTHRKGVGAFILTHLDEATSNVFEMAERYHTHCPELVKPSTSASNAKELKFDKLDSGYKVGTAKSKGTGRSQTFQYFHGSEVAYWANPESHVAGALQAVSNAPGTEVILESTSAGATGLFHKLCMDAQDGVGEYMLIFVPWFWQKEYRLPAVGQLTADEQVYQKAHGLDAEQMAWRRSKITELGGVGEFRREYPATVKEAFEAEVKGALWKRDTLKKNRIRPDQVPDLIRIVVAIDPAATSKATSDETGIIVAGLAANGHVYILEDLSGICAPIEWGRRAVGAYEIRRADRIIGEVNNGGEMVEANIRAVEPNASYKSVWASRGKRTRAEPIAALDEKGMIHHVGEFPELEDQMCSWDASSGQPSPDRMDARVWAVTELILDLNAKKVGVW